MAARNLTIPYTRVFGSQSNAILGVAIPALAVSPTLLGGFYSAPVQVPDDYKPSEASDLVLLISPAANSAAPGTTARIVTVLTTIDQTGIRTDTSFGQDVAIPNPWNTTDRLLVTLDNGTGHTFSPGSIDLAWTIAARVARDGPAGSDTFAQSLNLMQSLLWSYRQRCVWCCGPC